MYSLAPRLVPGGGSSSSGVVGMEWKGLDEEGTFRCRWIKLGMVVAIEERARYSLEDLRAFLASGGSPEEDLKVLRSRVARNEGVLKAADRRRLR